MTPSDLASIAAVAISGAGLAVAIVSLVVSHRTSQRDVPHLRVTASIGIPVGPGTEGAAPLVVIDVANDGRHREVVADVGFRVGENRVTLATTYAMMGELPKALEVGESMSARIAVPDLASQWQRAGMKRMDGVYARCASGRVYVGGVNSSIQHLAQYGRLPS